MFSTWGGEGGREREVRGRGEGREEGREEREGGEGGGEREG